MAWVFPVRSRLSVTVCCTGWATVTFGGGGGCGFGCSLQPACKARSTDTTSRVNRRFKVVTHRGRGAEQPTPVRALSHLLLDLGRHDVLALPDLPAAPQRPVHPDEAGRDVAE